VEYGGNNGTSGTLIKGGAEWDWWQVGTWIKSWDWLDEAYHVLGKFTKGGLEWELHMAQARR
jgi:hypothetical protein